MAFGKIVVFDSKFVNSLKILKTHSIFWSRGVNNKHHAAERWDLEFGFQTPWSLKAHSASPRKFSILWCLLAKFQVPSLRGLMFAIK